MQTAIADHLVRPPLTERTPNSRADYRVIRRDGSSVAFEQNKIAVAMTKAFLAVEGGDAALSRRIRETVEGLTAQVVEALFRRLPDGGTVHIEDIQDQVELALMRGGHHKIARAYVLYREERARERERSAEQDGRGAAAPLHVLAHDGTRRPLDLAELRARVQGACADLRDVSAEVIFNEALRNIYDGIAHKDIATVLIMGARVLIEKEPNYSHVAARLLLDSLRQEAVGFVMGGELAGHAIDVRYPEYFGGYITHGVELGLLDRELLHFDLIKLGAALKAERDLKFTYLGLQTLYDRYFLHSDGTRFELPQAFFMRVAMGLAIKEIDREARAIEFYDLLSSFDFMSSTPTLFNSGTPRPQLSSCYLTTVPDSLDGIYNAIRDNALLSKYAGGLGNDWTRVRGLGAHIKGTNGRSQGVVPFLKVANDTAIAVNQGGKRKGAVCAYLETWHIDILDFLELRKNTGDDRRRTHDMNTANWIPDLFMERVMQDEAWTLFSPDEVPELHDLVGAAFKEKYLTYEAKAERGELKVWKRLSAVTLWRKMLGQLFETGHPWITFKDPCNLRYTNQHMGVVHSSNLCTEITLHSSDSEVAVCNLGSINLAAHVDAQGLNLAKLEKTITLAMRMLDNVIDYNYYAVPQARQSNLRHRPVGLGVMGFQDALYRLGIAYDSDQAVEFADSSMEAMAYYAIAASTGLAEERGAYSTFKGSLWSEGILPIDSLKLLRRHRNDYLQVNEGASLDWETLRERVRRVGMRNSNCLAIAPTATISNICGVSPSIEPIYQNLHVKSNLSGEFYVVNAHLVQDLKELGLWDEVMINDLKYFDGSVRAIDRIPNALKQKYATAFEIDPARLIEAASRRQKWLDQAQSLNLYLAEPDGPLLDKLYKLAWIRGLKTTYYLRTLGATHVEKIGAPREGQAGLAENQRLADVCSIIDPTCEACQ